MLISYRPLAGLDGNTLCLSGDGGGRPTCVNASALILVARIDHARLAEI